MKTLVAILISFSLAISAFAANETFVAYEPSEVVLGGIVHEGKFKHPNGEWHRFMYLQLDAPVGVLADGENSFNVEEHNIREVQIYSDKADLRKSLDALVGKRVRLIGSLFHEHTVWHVRKLVLSVSSLGRSLPNHSFNPDALKRAG